MACHRIKEQPRIIYTYLINDSQESRSMATVATSTLAKKIFNSPDSYTHISAREMLCFVLAHSPIEGWGDFNVGRTF